jgi:hypothetical protein
MIARLPEMIMTSTMKGTAATPFPLSAATNTRSRIGLAPTRLIAALPSVPTATRE